MAEKCLMAASLAVLVFHPSLTIKCFKPKSCTTSPQREKPPPSKAPQPPAKRESSKSKKKQDPHADSSLSTASSRSNTNTSSTQPPPPLPPLSKTAKLFNVVQELVKGEPSFGIVETIFRSGWNNEIGLTIEKVLKVNQTDDVLNRFEEYREMVKSKAAETSVSQGMERLLADGNELLRFHGAVLPCSLGYYGFASICDKKCCGVCRVLSSKVSVKAGSLSLSDKSWKAHEKVSSACDVNGVLAKKAIILCRVIAGRVARYCKHGLVDGEKGGFDSLSSSTGDQSNGSEELIVFNQDAVLPCFVVIYNVH